MRASAASASAKYCDRERSSACNVNTLERSRSVFAPDDRVPDDFGPFTAVFGLSAPWT